MNLYQFSSEALYVTCGWKGLFKTLMNRGILLQLRWMQKHD